MVLLNFFFWFLVERNKMTQIIKGSQIFETEFAGKKLTIETGNFAMQASAAIMLTYGETVLMATAVISPTIREGIDFFPLMVEFEEKMYAAGKISGSRFIKREGRPSEDAILTSRLIDRPIRPLFEKGYRNDIQVVVTALSFDGENDPDFLGIIAASAALVVAGAPFSGPAAGVRVGLIDNKLVLNPTISQMVTSELDLIIGGTKNAILMVECGAKEVTEDKMVEALNFAHKGLLPAIEIQEKMIEQLKIKQKDFSLSKANDDLVSAIEKFLKGKLGSEIRHSDQIKRDGVLADLESQVFEDLKDSWEEAEIAEAFNKLIDMEVRRGILEDKERPDGRKPNEIRKITCQVGLLPRTHGSALFTRGQTQALGICTLSGPGNAQIIDTMMQSGEKKYMHHYNFPPYSTGEAKPLRGVGRREIGHGNLAERAIMPVLPVEEDFSYTVRSVTEILSSNGSTSMAATCTTSLALMDAGVPIKGNVAGIAMGLITKLDDKNKITDYVVLSDIKDVEDFAGDMDFKVAGTKAGITALQMDMKLKGIPLDILTEAINQANKGRLHILGIMNETIDKPREEVSKYAPRMTTLNIKPEKIKEVIGKGGETINKIIAQTGVEIDIQDNGLVTVCGVAGEKVKEAIEIIENIVREPEIGLIYQAKITRIENFGAFAEIMPGKEGLIHISQISPERIDKVTDVLNLGDITPVKLVEIDPQGRLNLSRKAALK
jgi:polyribonucleotide nucleotidyltransferase